MTITNYYGVVRLIEEVSVSQQTFKSDYDGRRDSHERGHMVHFWAGLFAKNHLHWLFVAGANIAFVRRYNDHT